ncbi:ABC transporter [Streptomyces sp. NBRC 14336]|uniref:ABC transporter permease n=1 Tax=Streptomyces sp. NBRC 14336 TaxID=3030992 RepID=UPI0024A58526|nr:ABC transporter permease [Streptomyces sp. NBRC 14336]WBO80840.1 ABC transporter permease [Streptomyces sp. SBE_14.2]GLW48098.1 ABC transporter [Streptomyces sp. NBRC 14336]
MLTATLKSLFSRKLRLVLSGLAIVLAVMFVSGAMVIKDTLNRSIDAQFNGAYDDIDLYVQHRPKVSAGTADDPAAVPPVAANDIAKAADVPGVAGASGLVLAEGARAVGKDGKIVPSTGGPRYGGSWRGESDLIELRSGHEPRAAGEVVINAALAQKAGLKVGDSIGVLTNEPRRDFTVAGVFGYSEQRDSVGGEQTVIFTEPVAQQLMLGRAGEFSGVRIDLASGASATEVAQDLDRRFGAGYDVLTGRELAEKASDKTRGILDMMSMLLLGFAAVAVLVGVFLIINTFSIIVAQRMGELALLRALGASRRQMIGSVLLESFAVGLVSSALGLAAGIGIGALGSDLLAGSTDGLKVASLGVPASAVVTAFAVGVVTTMLAALAPALRASKVAPLAVIRASAAPQGRHRKQTWTGAVLLALGALLLVLGSTGAGGISAILLGVLPAFVGVALLTPLVSGPAVRWLGALFARSLPGRLGRDNSARNPRRTAITASAMMIGVALVTAISTVAVSSEASVTRDIRRDLRADLVAMGEAGSASSASIDPAALTRIAQEPGVGNVAAAAMDTATVGKDTQSVASWQDWSKAREVLGLKGADGSVDTLAAGTVVMNESTADSRGLKVGDSVRVQLQRGEAHTYRVAGLFADSTLANAVVVPWADAQAGFRSKQPSQAYFELADGADTGQVQPRIEALLKDSPEVTVQTRDEVIDMFSGGFAMMLAVVQALLAVAMLIAVLGIVNTLALSILERTREMGALRAIGLSRGQTIRMIMTESVVISLFGAVLGVVVGAVLGLAVAHGMEDQGVTRLSLPWGQMLAYLIGAAVVGVIASLAPARRGARLNVLAAISRG